MIGRENRLGIHSIERWTQNIMRTKLEASMTHALKGTSGQIVQEFIKRTRMAVKASFMLTIVGIWR
jgi:hypothetical protein